MALGNLGKYERVDVLGHGATGIVYLAWDTMLKKQVALKEIDLQSADMEHFLEEARVMDRLNHPNIVRVFDVDLIEGHVVIVMEYVKGSNLQKILRLQGRLPLENALPIAIQTLDALDYAHRMRTVHRDIKPANILVSRAGEVKLVDFGLAEILATNSYAGGAGTYAYMAPEDFEEEHHSDHQSDIWAVGVTLYEMLTAARPFNVPKVKDPFSWRRVLRESPPTPIKDYLPEAPPQLETILGRALARDKRDRYASAGAFRDELRVLLQEAGQENAAPVLSAYHTYPTYPVAPTGYGTDAVVKNRFSPVPEAGDAAEPAEIRSGVLEGQALAASAAAQAVPVGASVVAGGRFGSSRFPLVDPMANPAVSPEPPASTPAEAKPRRKSVEVPTFTVEPNAVSFGEVRKGEERLARVRVRASGSRKDWSCEVISAPKWVSVLPATLDRRHPTLTLVAQTEKLWQNSDHADVVTLKTEQGELKIPISVRVMEPRLTFQQVFIWFVPLVLATLLPVMAVAWGAQFAKVGFLAPASALASALLAGMLLLIALAADLGFGEKLTCGVLLAVMTMMLGGTLNATQAQGAMNAVRPMLAVGLPVGFFAGLQVLSARYWKFWGMSLFMLSLVASGIFIFQIPHG